MTKRTRFAMLSKCLTTKCKVIIHYKRKIVTLPGRHPFSQVARVKITSNENGNIDTGTTYQINIIERTQDHVGDIPARYTAIDRWESRKRCGQRI